MWKRRIIYKYVRRRGRPYIHTCRSHAWSAHLTNRPAHGPRALTCALACGPSSLGRHSEILIENRRFNLFLPYLVPPLGLVALEFRRDFGIRKLESLGYRMAFVVCVILRLAIFVELRLVTDRQTDGQADTRWQHIPR